MAQKKSCSSRSASRARSSSRATGVHKRTNHSRSTKGKRAQCYDLRFVFAPESSLPSPLVSPPIPSIKDQPTKEMTNATKEAPVSCPNYPGIPESMVSRFSAAPLISNDPSIVPMKATIVSAFEAKGPLQMTKYAFQLEVGAAGDEDLRGKSQSPSPGPSPQKHSTTCSERFQHPGSLPSPSITPSSSCVSSPCGRRVRPVFQIGRAHV